MGPEDIANEPREFLVVWNESTIRDLPVRVGNATERNRLHARIVMATSIENAIDKAYVPVNRTATVVETSLGVRVQRQQVTKLVYVS